MERFVTHVLPASFSILGQDSKPTSLCRTAMMPPSKITGGLTKTIFRAKVLGKYDVAYFRCAETGFIQTEEPYWLQEAYHSAISATDLGLLSRNHSKSLLTQKAIVHLVPFPQTFLDYGGGYGIFTRLMRDAGFPFLHFDSYCENLFAIGHSIDSFPPANVDNAVGNTRFDLITAWEVFEHLTDPINNIGKILEHANAVLFSTVLVPNQVINRHEDWWYVMPDSGQHVSFYTEKSLQYIADRFGFHFYSDGISDHLFSRSKLRQNPLAPSLLELAWKKVRMRSFRAVGAQQGRPSLLQTDYELAVRSAQKRLTNIAGGHAKT